MVRKDLEGAGSQEERGEEGQGARGGERVRVSHRKSAALVAGEQLGRRHVVGYSAGRIVEGKLVFETPCEDADAQEQKSRREGAQDRTLLTQ